MRLFWIHAWILIMDDTISIPIFKFINMKEGNRTKMKKNGWLGSHLSLSKTASNVKEERWEVDAGIKFKGNGEAGKLIFWHAPVRINKFYSLCSCIFTSNNNKDCASKLFVQLAEMKQMETQAEETIHSLSNTSERFSLIENPNNYGVLREFDNIVELMINKHFHLIERLLQTLHAITYVIFLLHYFEPHSY